MKNKIAIFVCGSGGSGKSTFIKKYLNNFVHIDVDIIYEELLISNKLGLKIKDFNKDEIKLSGELLEKAKELNNDKIKNTILKNENLVIDGIGRDSDIIFHQRQYLENFGYKTYMIMLYADLDICIDRINHRERVYGINITEDSWYLSYDNIGTYKKEFRNNFKFIYNNVPDSVLFELDIFLNNSKALKIIL
jgi:predicted kinase